MDAEALSRTPGAPTAERHVAEGWPALAHELLSRGGLVLALGLPDSGKSSFLFWLALRAARQGCRVWVVDADVGQSDVGPPCAISGAPVPADLERAAGSHKPARPLRPESMFFVGSTSPRGNLLPMVTGTVRAVEDAVRQSAQLVLVNTTGWVSELPAVVLKVAKIDAVRPDVLLTFGDPTPLEPILDPYRHTRRPRIVACPPSPDVRRRSPEEREAARAVNWQGYFAGAQRRRVDLSRVGISGEARARAEATARGSLVGLYAPSGACRALGVVTSCDGAGWQILTPLADDVPIARVHVGQISLPSLV